MRDDKNRPQTDPKKTNPTPAAAPNPNPNPNPTPKPTPKPTESKSEDKKKTENKKDPKKEQKNNEPGTNAKEQDQTKEDFRIWQNLLDKMWNILGNLKDKIIAGIKENLKSDDKEEKKPDQNPTLLTSPKSSVQNPLLNISDESYKKTQEQPTSPAPQSSPKLENESEEGSQYQPPAPKNT